MKCFLLLCKNYLKMNTLLHKSYSLFKKNIQYSLMDTSDISFVKFHNNLFLEYNSFFQHQASENLKLNNLCNLLYHMFDSQNDKASIFVSICWGTDLLDTNNFIKKHNLGIHQDIFRFLCCCFHSIPSLVYISLNFCQEFFCLVMSYNLYIFQQYYMCNNQKGKDHTSWISNCKTFEEDKHINFWNLKEQTPPNIENMYLLFHIFCNL